MNTYTDKSMFTETAESILKNSTILIKSDCVIFNNVLYENISADCTHHKYRFFFCTDDYDYLDNESIIKELDMIFK